MNDIILFLEWIKSNIWIFCIIIFISLSIRFIDIILKYFSIFLGKKNANLKAEDLINLVMLSSFKESIDFQKAYVKRINRLTEQKIENSKEKEEENKNK